MTIIDTVFWWAGAAACIGVLVGLAALAWVWAVEKIVDALGFSRTIASWYIEKLKKERDAKRHAG